MVADKELIKKLTICKQSADVHTPNLNQAIVAEILRRNLLKGFVERACKVYSEQLNTMLAGLENINAITKYTKPTGGLLFLPKLRKAKM